MTDGRGPLDLGGGERKRDVGLDGAVDKCTTLGMADLAVVRGLIDAIVLGVVVVSLLLLVAIGLSKAFKNVVA